MLMSVHSGWKHVVCGFEEKTSDRFFRKLCEIYAGRRIDPKMARNGCQMSQRELRDAMDFVDAHYTFVRPNVKWNIKNVLDVMGDAVAMYGADTVCIDPHNRMIKPETHLRDDEIIVSELNDYSAFACEYNVCACTITHVNKPMANKDGTVAKPNRFQLLGGQATANAADQVVLVYNPKDPVDKAHSGRTFIVDKVRDIDLVGIRGEVDLDFKYYKRRYVDTYDGVEYDPMVGWEKRFDKEELKPIPLNRNFDSNDTDEVPF